MCFNINNKLENKNNDINNNNNLKDINLINNNINKGKEVQVIDDDEEPSEKIDEAKGKTNLKIKY